MKKNKAEYNQYMKEYMLKRYHRKREEAKAKLGGKCCKCGKIDGLEFDHIDPTTKKFTLAQLWSLKDTVFQEELSKCQLLCVECHKEKSKIDGVHLNKDITTVCKCGKIFTTIKQYAGHKTWCKE